MFGHKHNQRHLTPSDRFWAGTRWAGTGVALGAGYVADEMRRSQRGEIIPTTMGRTVGLASYPILSGQIASGVAMAAAKLGVGIPMIGPMAALAAIYPAWQVGRSVSWAVRELTDQAKEFRKLQFGGHYNDSSTAQQLRMQAVYEMSGATAASRRFLGQEAYFLHR